VAVNEPSLVTVRTSSGDIEAVGGEAEAGRGRTPRKFQTARPIRAGIINDFRLFDGMLHRFVRKAHITGPLHRLNVAIAVPSGMTEVERLAVIECIQNAGAVDVLLVNQALAAAGMLAAEAPRCGRSSRHVCLSNEPSPTEAYAARIVARCSGAPAIRSR